MTPRTRFLSALVVVLSVLPLVAARIEFARADELSECPPLLNCQPVVDVTDAWIFDLVATPPASGPADSSRAPQEVFALGKSATGGCLESCAVLFHSPDGGATWERRAAEGIGTDEEHPSTLVVAPGYPDDPRLYVTTLTGLRLSTDGGATFRQVSGERVAGLAVMSPQFSKGDRRILIGNSQPWVYDAGADSAAPYTALPVTRSEKHFVFAPDYETSQLLFAGAATQTPQGAADHFYMHRCVADRCELGAEFTNVHETPWVAVSSRFAETGTVLVWAYDKLFRSADRGLTFERVPFPGEDSVIHDMTQDGLGTFYAATNDIFDDGGGVMYSTDEGQTWTRVGAGTPLAGGAHTIVALANGRVIAAPSAAGAPGATGVLCSVNRGLTWDRRCP